MEFVVGYWTLKAAVLNFYYKYVYLAHCIATSIVWADTCVFFKYLNTSPSFRASVCVFLWWIWTPEGLTMLNGLITFCPGVHRAVEDALEYTGGRAQPGLCSYDHTISCCLGWRNVNGICQRKSFCVSVTAQLQWHITRSSWVIGSTS